MPPNDSDPVPPPSSGAARCGAGCERAGNVAARCGRAAGGRRVILELAAFAHLAAACAPRVAVETLAAVARAGSGLDPLAVHDNAAGRAFAPGTSPTSSPRGRSNTASCAPTTSGRCPHVPRAVRGPPMAAAWRKGPERTDGAGPRRSQRAAA